MKEFLHKDLSEKLIGAFYNVYNSLGFGFLEKVYENAYSIELDSMCLNFNNQQSIEVFYSGQKVGNYIADIIVENSIIVEVKAVETLRQEHECQLLNYLKATKMEVGLLLNFGKKPEFKRLVFSNNRKSLP